MHVSPEAPLHTTDSMDRTRKDLCERGLVLGEALVAYEVTCTKWQGAVRGIGLHSAAIYRERNHLRERGKLLGEVLLCTE